MMNVLLTFNQTHCGKRMITSDRNNMVIANKWITFIAVDFQVYHLGMI